MNFYELSYLENVLDYCSRATSLSILEDLVAGAEKRAKKPVRLAAFEPHKISLSSATSEQELPSQACSTPKEQERP